MSTQHTPASKHLKKPCILNVRSATGWQPVSQTCREGMITCVYSMNGTLEDVDVLRKCAGTGTHDFQHYIHISTSGEHSNYNLLPLHDVQRTHL